MITFEPVVSQLAHKKPSQLFTSADIPGRIVDVIAIRPEILDTHPAEVKQLIAGHFRALKDFQRNPEDVSPILAKRLKLPPEAVPQTYVGLELPDIAGNHELLQGSLPKLENSAKNLKEIMLQAQLLRKNVQVTGLIDGRFLPKA